MLLQFAVTNYLSFRDTTVLALAPAPSVPHLNGQTAATGNEGVPEVLRAAVVYGPNGAGKSNLIKALSALLEMIEVGHVLPARPFRLGGADVASTFELEVILGGQHLCYGLRIKGRSVAEEWLSRVDGADERTIFHRSEDASWADAIDVPADIAPAVVALAKNIPTDRTFLRTCGVAGLGEFGRIYGWVGRRVWPASAFARWWQQPLAQWADTRSHAEDLLKSAGVGDVEIGFAVDSVADEATRERFSEIGVPLGVPLTPDQIASVLALGDAAPSFAVRIMRKHPDGHRIPFSLDEESDGTRRLLELAAWHDAIANFDAPLGIIDEMERSLHPLVVRLLLERLIRPGGTGQLVCTTHDSNLLDRTLLTRDSIWFMQKGPDGASRLYSLAEFNAEELALLEGELEDGYLQGRFGAIPFAASPARLGWKAGA